MINLKEISNVSMENINFNGNDFIFLYDPNLILFGLLINGQSRLDIVQEINKTYNGEIINVYIDDYILNIKLFNLIEELF